MGSRWKDRCWQLSLPLRRQLIQLLECENGSEIAVNWRELSNMINNCTSHQMAGNIYQTMNPISHKLLFLAQLRANTASPCSYGGVLPRKLLSDLCQSTPAPLCSGTSSVQPSACRSAHKPRNMSGVHPLHKCWVQGFWETSRMQHQHKKKTSCSAVTPVLDDTPEDMERRLPLSSYSRLGARTPPSDTKAALPLSAGLFPRLFCLFVSRHRAHSLDATRFHSVSSELDPAIWKKNLLVEIMMLPSKEGLKVWYWTNF